MEPLTIQAAPRALLGRVSAVITTSWTLVLLIATALAGYIDSTVLNHFHHVILGITFSSVDTLFTVAGILLIVSGVYFMRNLQGVTFSKETEDSVNVTKALELRNENAER